MADTSAPPKPNAEDFLQIIRRQKLGKLKVYLGASPGVGKTYEMLIEGNRLKERGVDVVIGYVEPHNRPDTTAQIKDLEIVPPRSVQYHGVQLGEMDVDAVLARHPTVALVDELAHTNAPGSKNRKRYEDVQDLLAAGINVITTVNIQHLESLYNIVEQATGVCVKERIPDEIVAGADQIVNVDLPSEDLLERLQAGKIYPKERIERALKNFFTEKNLIRLREMTLSETANYLDRKQRESSEADQPQRSLGLVAVAISSKGPDPGCAAAQKRAARRAVERIVVRRLRPHAERIPGQHSRRSSAPHYRHAGDRTKNGRQRHRPEKRRCCRRVDFFRPNTASPTSCSVVPVRKEFETRLSVPCTRSSSASFPMCRSSWLELLLLSCGKAGGRAATGSSRR